jgi:hypothetical protein
MNEAGARLVAARRIHARQSPLFFNLYSREPLCRW